MTVPHRGTRSVARCLGLALAVAVGLSVATAAGAACSAGEWWRPGGERLYGPSLHRDLARGPVVLLGERHDRMEHHRWQLSTLMHLHAHRSDMVIALEMLPRSVQPVLDDWVAGDLAEDALLAGVEWYEHWGFPAELYLPIFHFARMHGIPIRAVNLERATVRRIGAEGWQAADAGQGSAIGPAADPLPAYREHLEAVYEKHAAHGGDGNPDAFVRAQLARDRAMAEGVLAIRESRERSLVVLLAGEGHLAHGHGVPAQLADLGINDAPVLLPRSADEVCRSLDPGLARAVFILSSGDRHEHRALSLGIVPEEDNAGVRVAGVEDGSAAAEAGLRSGDVLVEAAGRRLDGVAPLRRIVDRQAAGTWLPLIVRRDGRQKEVVVRFPPPDADE